MGARDTGGAARTAAAVTALTALAALTAAGCGGSSAAAPTWTVPKLRAVLSAQLPSPWVIRAQGMDSAKTGRIPGGVDVLRTRGGCADLPDLGTLNYAGGDQAVAFADVTFDDGRHDTGNLDAVGFEPGAAARELDKIRAFIGSCGDAATVSKPATSGADETLDIVSHDGYGAHEILMLRHQDVIIGVTCNFGGPGKPGSLGPLGAALAANG
ncbi:MAG TPA: hypothetical protein VFU74_09015 [Actinocrinis sp.]|nr:hypothetical protein [Actinocrinis sp.]